MTRPLRSPKWRAAVAAWAVLLVAGGGLLHRNWAAVQNTADCYRVYWWFCRQPDGLTRDLANGRFKAGDPVRALVAARRPCSVYVHGRYAKLTFISPADPGHFVVYVTTRDDLLVRAKGQLLLKEGEGDGDMSVRTERMHTFFDVAARHEDAVPLGIFIGYGPMEFDRHPATPHWAAVVGAAGVVGAAERDIRVWPD